jgi:ABC-2 type transport system permease protein
VPDHLTSAVLVLPIGSAVAGRHGLYLLAFTLVVAYLSTRAFRTYQRSV